MAGGLLLNPYVSEDLDYPAYYLRLLNGSLGEQAGVVGGKDFKVTAGSGLQVNVEKGKAFIEQTKATQESSNTFYNGLYNVLNPIEQNPYNVVVTSTSNPQIAQIILRIYDVNELKISGGTYGRIEWANGTPNAGATKAHIEAGEASSYGAAALPQSSLSLCYILVPKNATTSTEFEIFDRRTFCNNNLVLVNRNSNFNANNGEMAYIEGSHTATLPPAVENARIGFLAVGGEATIKTISSSQHINGDFISGLTTIKLTENQHIIFRGTVVSSLGNWRIESGEPKREQVYSSITEHAATLSGYEIIPSNIRPTTFNITQTGEVELTVSIDGEAVIESKSKFFSVKVLAGQLLKVQAPSTTTIKTSFITE